jgi:hypothetical protein
MAITILTDASPSAPDLTGIAGSLIAVLDFCLVTTLGWTKPHSTTNIASYLQPAGSNGFSLWVDDTAGQNARLRGYETMSAHSTGTGPFPTDAQLSGGGYIYKSTAANSTARPWLFISDGKRFHFFHGNDTTEALRTAGDWRHFFFGDVFTYKSGDAYNTMLQCDLSSSVAGASHIGSTFSYTFNALTNTGCFLARAHTQLGSSAIGSKFFDWAALGQSSAGAAQMSTSSGPTYPSPVDGALHVSKVWLGEAAGRRGVLPGLWTVLHADSGSMVNQDTFSGAGDLAGKTFTYVRLTNGTGRVAVETSDTWSI